MAIALTINGQRHEVDVPPEMPLLWVIRDESGSPARSMAAASRCAAPAPCMSTARPPAPASPPSATSPAAGDHDRGARPRRQPSGAEGMARASNVPQCGYCQAGQIMQAAALLATTKNPSERPEINDAMSGNICRCGCYQRIHRRHQGGRHRSVSHDPRTRLIENVSRRGFLKGLLPRPASSSPLQLVPVAQRARLRHRRRQDAARRRSTTRTSSSSIDPTGS